LKWCDAPATRVFPRGNSSFLSWGEFGAARAPSCWRHAMRVMCASVCHVPIQTRQPAQPSYEHLPHEKGTISYSQMATGFDTTQCTGCALRIPKAQEFDTNDDPTRIVRTRIRS
jgi:hypothetical protein